MADNKNERTPRDAQRINVNEDYEVTYWTKALNISKDKLIELVKRVGPMASRVREEMKSKKAS